MMNTTEIVKWAAHNCLAHQERFWDDLRHQLGITQFAEEMQTVKLSLPRRSGKTTAIVESFRIGIDIVVTHNDIAKRDMIELILRREKRDRLDWMSILPWELDAVQSSQRKILNETVFSIHELGRPGTYKLASHKKFLDYEDAHRKTPVKPIIYFDETFVTESNNQTMGAYMSVQDFRLMMNERNVPHAIVLVGTAPA